MNNLRSSMLGWMTCTHHLVLNPLGDVLKEEEEYDLDYEESSFRKSTNIVSKLRRRQRMVKT